MTTAQIPQIDNPTLKRIELLLDKTSQAHGYATTILDQALADAATYPIAGEAPASLKDDNIGTMMRMKEIMSELQGYYTTQLTQLRLVVETSRSAAQLLATHDQQQTKKEIPATHSIDDIRARVQRSIDANRGSTAGTAGTSGSTAPMAVSATMDTMMMGMRALGSSGAEPQAGSGPSMYIPMAQPMHSSSPSTEKVGRITSLPAVAIPSQLEAPVPQNSLAKLFGNDSPLLNIFAPSPWVPDGRGKITVGSAGFNWFKRTNPLECDNAKRATLPSGFYSGDDRPQCAILRLEESILIWTFDLSPESMLVYMAGLSDADGTSRWFKPSDLSSSYAQRLVRELEALNEVLAATL